MKRRNFFLLSFAGLATIAVPSYFLWIKNHEKEKSIFVPQMLSTILEPIDIKTLGKSYRNQFSDDEMDKKLQYFMSTHNTSGKYRAISMEQVVKNDYINGYTVVLDGWVLSETEALQCALFTLSETKRL